MKFRQVSGVAHCIGCGCHDYQACESGCWWLHVDYPAGVGVCSECEGHVERWDAGDRSVVLAVNGKLGMEGTTELTIVAQSQDEFDDLVDRVESLADAFVKVVQGDKRFFGRPVQGFMENDDDLTVRIQFDVRVLRILNIVDDGMQALLAVEGLTKH